MPFAAADAYGPANLALPVSISKPLVREAGARLQTQPVPLAIINTPATTLPFAAAEPYTPAKPVLPAAASRPILKTEGNRAQTQVAVPMVVANAPASTMPVATNAGPAGIMIPATVSKPLVKDASSRMTRNCGSGAGQFLCDQYPCGGNAFRDDGYLWCG